jgi:hypothetical protein
MRSGMSLSNGAENPMRGEWEGKTAKEEQSGRLELDKNCGQQDREEIAIGPEECGEGLPARVRATVVVKSREYDARRLRSQREVIRDVMLAAADCDTWLTLAELRAVTRYGEASISAQLRHLRKLENGGYDVSKQRRDGAVAAGTVGDGRGDCVWEYRVVRILQPGRDEASPLRQEILTDQ